jgi:hypothetical protein
MPIVDVTLVVPPDARLASDLAQRLADAAGVALGSTGGETWLRLHTLAGHHYAENQSMLAPDELPVFVTVLKRQLPRDTALEHEIAALVTAIAQVTGREASRVHVEYAPAAIGRLALGGRIVT